MRIRAAGRNSQAGFHDGERAVQRIAGVEREAARLEGMLAPADISTGMAGFLAQRTFAAITARDHAGRLWTSPLVAPAGFLKVLTPTTVQIRTTPAAGDPLHNLRSGQPLGLIAVDYFRGRRFRLNGTLVATSPDRLDVVVDEAFGNCPQYIPQRTVEPDTTARASHSGVAHPHVCDGPLSEADRLTITTANTFLLGTTHPERGNDASHRGGAPGFVRLDGGRLWWPDYPGNNLFTSLGNLRTDPEAALLFPDFAGRSALYLHGTAELVVADASDSNAEGGTGRLVAFTPVRHKRTLLVATSELVAEYPRNPRVTTDPPIPGKQPW